MLDRAEKVMLLGIDSVIAPRVYRFALEGKLPVLQRLMQNGVYATNALVGYPTITPPNWTTIATGANDGTHGITDFDGHVPGDPLNKVHQNMDAREIQAETLWQSATRAGKRSIVVCWPTSWPTVPEGGFRLSGYGNNINDWRINVERTATSYSSFNLTHDILITTEDEPFATTIAWRKAQGWEGVEHGPKALEAEVDLVIRRPQYQMKPVVWHLLVDSMGGDGYDTVLVSRSKSKQDVFARLRVGEWTPNLYDTFETEAGPKKAVFRLKLLALSRDAKNFRLFVPGLNGLTGWGGPAEVEEEIHSDDGMPMGRAGWESFDMGWIDDDTLLEIGEFTHNWLADASLYLLKNKLWDLYFIHIHTIDWAYHSFCHLLDPALVEDPTTLSRFERLELECYKGVDRCLGRLLEAADPRTLVMVVSDHGAKPGFGKYRAQDILEQAGLLAYLPQEEDQPRRVDWSRTKAVAQRRVHIYVNVKGRDPDGIVAPGEEYEQVIDQVIDALYSYRDPQTGRRPVSLALRREDARLLGLYGDKVGDVIYAFDPRFDDEHGSVLPTARFGVGDLRGLFIMAGPGVKQGGVIERTIRLTDYVPTICHLAELPLPEQCEGGVIYQALEDPDAKTKELAALRRNIERLKKMVERPPMC